MELELGFKLTRVADELTSGFQVAKDRSGPVFTSRETEAMFVLDAHLKGYRRRNIKIDINEDGTLIAISGEKQVQETVMISWQVHKKDTVTKSFKKVFKIPEGVILDKITAAFNEDESTLTITMPKKVKGIHGTSIEEIKEKQELVKQGSGTLHIQDEKWKDKTGDDDKPDKMVSEIVETVEEKRVEEPVSESVYTEDVQKPDPEPLDEQDLETKMTKDEEENQKKIEDTQQTTEVQQDQELDQEKENDIHEHAKSDEEHEPAEPSRAQEAEPLQKPEGKRCKMCIPIVAGSTILLSFVIFVIQIIRSKNQNNRRRDRG